MVVKMPKINERTKKITWTTSAIIAIAIVMLALLTPWWNSFHLTLDDAFFFTIIAAVFPPAILVYVDYRWRKAVDEHLPDLFRSIVQAEETGMTLPQALVEASKRDYGPLTAELKKMTTQMSWGMSFEEALLGLSERVNTVLVRRTVPMVIEASHSGGHVEKIFDPMGKFIQSTLLLDKERRAQTKPYIAIVYVAFFVFIFTIVLLFKSFFVSTEQLPIMAAAVMSPDSIKELFFHMTIVQSLFGGIVAGKMGEGTVSAGLKHSLILIICGYVAVKLFL